MRWSKKNEICTFLRYNIFQDLDKLLLAKITFSDETTFHLLGTADMISEYGEQQSYWIIKHMRDGQKWNLVYALST
jgi:hypothetical protein